MIVRWLGVIGTVGGLCVLPTLLPNDEWVRLAALVLLWSIPAAGWNILAGYCGQVSFGHAAFFGLGAYTSTLLFAHLGLTPWIGLVVAAVVSGLAGFLIGLPTLRMGGAYFALSTLAFQLILRLLFTQFREITGGSTGMTLPFRDGLAWLEFNRPLPYYYVLLVAVLAITAGMIVLGRSRLGSHMQAVRADEQAAEAIGVDTYGMKLVAMALSCALTGVAGVLYAQFFYFIDPESVFGFHPLLQMILISIVGGLGTPIGPVLGAMALVPVYEMLNLHLGASLPGLNEVLYGALLMLVVLVIPRGIAGSIRRYA